MGGEIDLPRIGRLVLNHDANSVEFHIVLHRPPTDGPDAQTVGTHTLQTIRAELRKVLEYLMGRLDAELEGDCTYLPDGRGGVGTFVVPLVPKGDAEEFDLGPTELLERLVGAVCS